MKLSANARHIFSGRVIGLGMGRQAFAGGGLVALLCMQALAGPEGERVVQGSAQFTRNGSNTVIQAANNTIIDYRSFNIGANESVQFVQPGATARVLNRVPDGINPTRIDGSLSANGIVYIVNSAGVYFGERAVVNAAGLYAAAGQITNAEFLSNVNHFTGLTGTASNSGTINAQAVALIGKHAENLGTINAERGLVTMAAGDEVFIGEVGDTMMVQVAGATGAGVQGTGVNNAGTINAPGGNVRLAAGDMYSLALKMPGRITARNTRIEAHGNGTAIVSGTIDARGVNPGETGGRVEVLGDRVALAGATIDASGPAGGGTVLVGGDFQGRGDVPTASQTVVTAGSTIRADATDRGDAGTVIVWSDQLTRYHGSISAQGGANGGDGGFVEVSGKQHLQFNGAIDTGAVSGRDGTILLDPQDIVIQQAAGADDAEVGDESVLFPDGGPATTFTIGEAALEALTGSITLQADRDITVQGNVTLDLLNLGDGEAFTLQAGRNVTVLGTITTGGGDIVFSANDPGGVQANGSIFLTNDLSTAGAPGVAGDITLTVNGGSGTLQLGGDLFTDGGNINLNAPVVLTAGSFLDTDLDGGTTDAGDVTFAFDLDGGFAIGIDARADGGGAGGDVTLRAVGQSGPALALLRALGNMVTLHDDITVAGEVRLGDGGTVVLATLPLITIDNTGGANADVILGNVTGNRGLTVLADAASPLTLEGADVDSLTLTGGEVTISGTIETDTPQDYSNVGAMTLLGPTSFIARDSDNANAPQDITFVGGNAITGAFPLALLGDNVVLPAAGNGSDDPASLQITAAGNVTVGDVLAGSATIDADSDDDGTGTFTVTSGTTLGVSTGALTVTAADAVIDGSIDAGTQAFRIDRSVAGTIGLGDGTGDLVLAKDELSRVGAGSLVVGGSSNSVSINVDNVEAGDVADITGSVELDATGAGGAIVFGSAASVFPALTARADDGITLGSDLTTTVGGLVLDADADNAADTSDTLALGAMRTLLAAGDITLDATTGGITGGGNITLAGAGNVSINDSFNSGGGLTVAADSDMSGAGAVLLAAGATLTSADGPVALTAADVSLDGSIVAGTGSVTIDRSSVGEVRVGGTALAGELGVAAEELERIAANSLTIGGANTDLLTLEAITSDQSDAIAGVTQLNALANGGRVVVDGAAVFPTLSVSADDGVTINQQLGSGVGDLVINANADNADDSDDSVTLAQSISLAAGNDLIVTGNGVTLAGATGTTNTFTSGTDGNVVLPSVMAPSSANMVIVSEGGITLASADLVNGTLEATADIDADGTAVLGIGQAVAGNIVLSGGSDINDTVRISISASGTNGVRASNALAVELGGGATVSSAAGNIDFADNVASVLLTGADGTTATVSGNAGTATFAPIVADNNANLTIDIDGGAVFTAADLNAGNLVVNAPLSAPASSGITIEAGDVAINGGLTTTGGGAVSITNSGTLTIAGTSPVIIDGAFSQLGAGPTNLAGDLGTSGDAIVFTGPVVLTGPATLSTGAGAGDVSFLGAVRSDAESTPRSLSITTGTGNLTMAGAVGDGGLLDQLLLQLVNNATFNGVVVANSVRQANGSGTTTFQDSIIAQGSGGIDLDGAAFVFRGGVVTTTPGAGFSITNTATADFQATANIALAGAFLQDGTGPVTLAAPITTSLAPISFSGAVTIPQAITISNNGAGNINFGNTLTTTAPVTIDGAANGTGNINFNGAVASSGELVARTGSGSVTFGNSVTATSALTADTDSGAIAFNGPLSVSGALSATSNSGSVSFSSSVNTGSAFSVRTQTGNIAFGGVLNGTAAGSGIVLLNSGTGDINFAQAANVGLTNPVNRFTATGRNVSLRSVVTRGTTAAGDGDITLTPALGVGDSNVPSGVLRVNGDLVANDGNITIAGSGHSGIPSAATTVLGNPELANGATLPTITIAANSGDLLFGAGDKVTAFGNLSLVGRNVTISDVTALGNLNVNAGQAITVRLRPGSLLLTSNADGTDFGASRTDFGTNIVSGGAMAFTSSSFTTTGTGNATFATPTGSGSGVPGNFPVAMREPFTASSLRAGSTVLSLDASGTTNTDLATALPQDVPLEGGIARSGETVVLDEVAVAQLAELGIGTRGADAAELRDAMSGRAIFQDVVLDPDAVRSDEMIVSWGRLPPERVAALLAAYRGAFKATSTDPATGEALYADRSELIRAELAGALERFRKEGLSGTIDPVEFRRYLDRSPMESAAYEHVEALERFLDQLRLLGLGPREERLVRERALSRVTPEGMTARELGEVIEAEDPGLELD